MNRSLLLLFACLLVPPMGAFAEDEPPVTATNRSGLYAGVHAGAQWGNHATTTGALGYNGDNQRWDYGQSGVAVAGEFGYDAHWNSLVLGPVVELGYVGLNGSGAQPGSPGDDTLGKSGGDFYSALRARVGMDFDPYLVFVAVGPITVHRESRVVDECGIAPCGGTTVDARESGFSWGYTIGGGVEYKILENWSAKLEYLYFNLGDQSVAGTTSLGTRYDWTGAVSGNLLRVGLDFHF